MTKLEAIRSIEKMELPAPLKAAAAMALTFMDEKTLDQIFGAAQEAITKLQAGDRTAAEAVLAKIGLPPDVTKQLLDKVSPHGNHSDG